MSSDFWFWNSEGATTSPLSLVVIIAFTFILLALTLMVTIFVSRIWKSRRQKQSETIRERAQGILNTLIVNETFGSQTESSFNYRIRELQEMAGSSSFNNNVIIQLLLQMRKNLSGSSSSLLLKVYQDLHLEKYSLRKLRGITWKEQALGIRELTEMQHHASAPRIAKFLRSRNSILREESFMAMVRLESEKPFWFLDGYTDEITPWMKLNIHSYLQKQDARKLPDFSKWFDHHNNSVKLFSIAMSAQFRQTASSARLADMARDNSADVAIAAIDTLAIFEAFDFAPQIAKILADAADEKIIIAGLTCIGKIGDPASSLSVLQKYLGHESYNVRYASALASKALGQESFSRLKQLNHDHHLNLDEMIAHLEEPLLQ